MNDRELLQLAAKAAGYTLTDHYDVDGRYWPWCHELERNWCPLGDDGDAFRLANTLRLTVYHAELAVIVKHKQYSWDWIGEGVNEVTGDRDASARRAIVMGAAEIGRRMG